MMGFKESMTSSDDPEPEAASSPELEVEIEAEPLGEFETFAAEALGTDDPVKLSALKEAIMACMGAEKMGGYDKGIASGEGEMLETLFGGKK